MLDAEDYDDYDMGPCIIAEDLSRTPYGRAMAQENAMNELKGFINRFNAAGLVYPENLANVIKQLLHEYDELRLYDSVIADYNRHRLRYEPEEGERIRWAEFRISELKWFVKNVRDDLLNPKSEIPEPPPVKKRGFLSSLFS